MDIVDNGVFVVGFGDELQHIFVILAGKVEPDDVEAVVEEGRQDARLRIALLSGDQDVV